MDKAKSFLFIFLVVPVMTSTPVGQEGFGLQASPSGLVMPDLQASPSGLVKQDLNFKVEGYVKQPFDFDQELEIYGEKVKDPASSVTLKPVGLIPAPPDTPSTEAKQGVGVPKVVDVEPPQVVEVRVDGHFAVANISRASDPEGITESKEVEIEQVVTFLNECHLSGPEPLSVEVKDLPPSKYELSPKFSVGDEGIIAQTGDYLVYINVPVSFRVGLEGGIAGDAALRNSGGKILTLPYQAIELAQKRNRLVTNIAEVRLTNYGSNPSVYRIKSFERLEFFGLVNFETEIEMIIDANTGKTLTQPWFSLLPSSIIRSTI